MWQQWRACKKVKMPRQRREHADRYSRSSLDKQTLYIYRFIIYFSFNLKMPATMINVKFYEQLFNCVRFHRVLNSNMCNELARKKKQKQKQNTCTRIKLMKMSNLTKWRWLTSSEKSPRCLTSSVSVRSCISSREMTFLVFISLTRPSTRGASTVTALSSVSSTYSITVWSSSDGKCSIAFGPSTSSSPGFRRCKK